MFKRPEETYTCENSVLDAILNDESSPHYNILELIEDNSSILDIGAGNGILAQVLRKSGKSFQIDGIEPCAKACEIAAPYYRNLYQGYIQDYIDKINFEDYDYIVMADLIEHVSDPLDLLQNISDQISAKTKVIIDVPNVSFASVRLSLLKGIWDYSDSGLIEKTHLRFFTKKTLLAMFKNANFKVEKIINLRHEYDKTEIPVQIGQYSWGTINEINQDKSSSVYQYLFILSKGFEDAEIPIKDCGRSKKIYFFKYLIERIKYCLKHLF